MGTCQGISQGRLTCYNPFMAHTLQRWLAACLLTGILSVPLFAQADAPPARELRGSTPEYTIAFIVTALVLTIVCMPSQRS